MDTKKIIDLSRGINVLSLFDGISCGMVALERAGIKVNKYYASEVNDTSIAISKYNHKNIIHVGDVRNLTVNDFENIDIIIGGSPCQNFSFSGTGDGATTVEGIEITTLEQYLKLKNNGFEFKGQSYLFWEYVRLLKEINPKIFLLENVKMAKKWEKIISETVGVDSILINSNLLSAQNRPRLYWSNIDGIEQPKDKNLFIKDVLNDEYSDKEKLSQKIIDRFKPIDNSSYCIGTTKPEFRTIGQRDYVFGDGNKMGCLTATDYKQPKQVLHNGIIRKISPLEAERFQTLDDNYTRYGDFNGTIKEISNTKRFECIGNGWTVDVIAHILSFIK